MDNLGWDRSMKRWIPYSFIISIKPIFLLVQSKWLCWDLGSNFYQEPLVWRTRNGCTRIVMCFILVKDLMHNSTRNSRQRLVSSQRLSTQHSLHNTNITWIPILSNWNVDLRLLARCGLPIWKWLSELRKLQKATFAHKNPCIYFIPHLPHPSSKPVPNTCSKCLLHKHPTTNQPPFNLPHIRFLWSQCLIVQDSIFKALQSLPPIDPYSLPFFVPISLHHKHTSMSKTPHQFFHYFIPQLLLGPMIRSVLTYTTFTSKRRLLLPLGLAWSDSVLLWLY